MVYAFCGGFSYSRLPFIPFTLRQDAVCFTQSHVQMFNFYGGVPQRIVLDNLKAGVLSADLYDPSEYGHKRYGTTGVFPWEAYQKIERAALQPLPA